LQLPLPAADFDTRIKVSMQITTSTTITHAYMRQQPLVALESTVIAHGLPYPQNVAVARAMEALVREHGAVPATIGVVAGVATVGLDDATLERFAQASDVRKLARRDIPLAIADGAYGATTVSATMACWLMQPASKYLPRVELGRTS
jgi:pseudouridine-5'-phosphate glycosidase